MIRATVYKKAPAVVTAWCDGCGNRPRYSIEYHGITPKQDAQPDLCKRCAETTVRRLIKMLARDDRAWKTMLRRQPRI